MYLFFMISGFLFVIGLSIIFSYLFDIFSINKITKFLSPLEDTIFNNISISVIPNILWSLIEIVILGSNYYFMLGFLLNIFVSMCIMYVIKYGYVLISEKENDVVNIIAILFSSFFGFLCNYLCLMIGTYREINTLYSIIGILVFICFYLIIRFFPPNSDFFRGGSV